jgi:lipid II:glycine glycyltransferase (peptidoglycan interpeptide bridge formation enzyme)
MIKLLSVYVIDPITNPSWKAFVQSHSNALIFHHPAWLNLLYDQYKFETLALCLQQDDQIIAGIPFCKIKTLWFKERWVCLPFSDYCGPLSSSSTDLRILIDQIRSWAIQKRIPIEIRSRLEPDFGFAIHNAHWLHIANIEQEPEDLLKILKPRIRRALRKAQNNRLINEIRRDQEAMDIFYQLHLKTRKKQGVPIQPRGYFRLFQKHIIGRGLGFISLTRNNTQYLSAAVFCEFNKMIIYKYGASDPAHLGLSPNHLMFWETILYAKQQGLSRFDFGKTALPNTGLRDFKRGWNTTETELLYSYFPTAPSTGLFDILNHKVVEPVIKHSPTFVCRLAGEVLYKYFAV